MRRAVACLPAPGSANSSTGTSLCDSSRITASTGRMLALAPSTNAPAMATVASCAFPLSVSGNGFPILLLGGSGKS